MSNYLFKMKQTQLKVYLDEVCDMLDTYGGRDKVILLFMFVQQLIAKSTLSINICGKRNKNRILQYRRLGKNDKK